MTVPLATAVGAEDRIAAAYVCIGDDHTISAPVANGVQDVLTEVTRIEQGREGGIGTISRLPLAQRMGPTRQPCMHRLASSADGNLATKASRAVAKRVVVQAGPQSDGTMAKVARRESRRRDAKSSVNSFGI